MFVEIALYNDFVTIGNGFSLFRILSEKCF